jgi:hypothetical protein
MKFPREKFLALQSEFVVAALAAANGQTNGRLAQAHVQLKFTS